MQESGEQSEYVYENKGQVQKVAESYSARPNAHRTSSTKERVKSAHAQFETANALYQQALDKFNVGLAAKVDADRSQVEALVQQQRVISLDTDLAKQKINLARMTDCHLMTNTKLPIASLSWLRRRSPWTVRSFRRSQIVPT